MAPLYAARWTTPSWIKRWCSMRNWWLRPRLAGSASKAWHVPASSRSWSRGRVAPIAKDSRRCCCAGASTSIGSSLERWTRSSDALRRASAKRFFRRMFSHLPSRQNASRSIPFRRQTRGSRRYSSNGVTLSYRARWPRSCNWPTERVKRHKPLNNLTPSSNGPRQRQRADKVRGRGDIGQVRKGDHLANVQSFESSDGSRCIDVIGDYGRFYFKEFRRDPEDAGRWTLVADFSELSFATSEDALHAARRLVVWLRDSDI